jgi:5-oxoprolinase (ATP-hydrolysing)
LRADSGGRGAHRGGNGVIRRIRFREAMGCAILSTRRETEPFGMAGGHPGKKGQNMLIRKDGSRVILRGCDEIGVAEGDAVEIQTPGGGGYGKDTP